MDTFVTILVIAVFLAALAYFKVPKVKEFVDSKVFRKKKAPSAFEEEVALASIGLIQDYKKPVEASKPVLATTPLPTPQKPAVEALKASQTPIPVFNPEYHAVEEAKVISNGQNFYFQETFNFTDVEYSRWIPFSVLPDFHGRVKVTVTESSQSPAGDKSTYKFLILDNTGNPISPELNTQYTGGSLTGATTDRLRFGDHFGLLQGYDYMVAVMVTKPVGVDAKVIVTINGSAM